MIKVFCDKCEREIKEKANSVFDCGKIVAELCDECDDEHSSDKSQMEMTVREVQSAFWNKWRAKK
jgi:hypothetical protein